MAKAPSPKAETPPEDAPVVARIAVSAIEHGDVHSAEDAPLTVPEAAAPSTPAAEAAPEDAAGVALIALSAIDHDGRHYAAGETLTVAEAATVALVAAGAARLAEPSAG